LAYWVAEKMGGVVDGTVVSPQPRKSGARDETLKTLDDLEKEDEF
jgi:hypothetical protein